MSKGSGWVPIDKMMAQEFKKIKRPFSKIEAMFSYSLDINSNRQNSIKGYARLWGWSRNKVRKFITESTSNGHYILKTTTDKGHPIHFIDKDLWFNKDTEKSDKQLGATQGHLKDTLGTLQGHPKHKNDNGLGAVKDTSGTLQGHFKDTTNNPNPNPKDNTVKNFSRELASYISSVHKNKAPKITEKLINQSADTVNKLIRIDGFTLDYIQSVCQWAIGDDFYHTNFFSLAALRKKSSNGATKFANMAAKYDKQNGQPVDIIITKTREQLDKEIEELMK